jgi:hypothetical protein
MKVKQFMYVKDSGDSSVRQALEVSPARENALMLDVGSLSPTDIEELKDALIDANEYRDAVMKKVAHLVKWRTFKPSGIVPIVKKH